MQRKPYFWLEKAYDEHNPDLIELTMEPSFDTRIGFLHICP